MKNLRVAVIPTETGNGIDQNSTVDKILNCDELQLYPLTDYFQAQNDEEIDLLHWSFLIDIEEKINLTGTYIDGIHYHSKPKNDDDIIKDIITRKKCGIDCTEAESSEIKGYLRENYNSNNKYFTDTIYYFPLEHAEIVDELEERK